ncbi:MAG: U32 family peptidase, partial [Clostridiales bacterium]|nr:U32 family peptidase [Candidatus Blautia equi]
MVRREEIELLAPAGSFEGFQAVLGAGADAVYMGGTAFGARAYAKNFGEEELLRAIDLAHLHNRKLYLTVNTLLKNQELEEQLYNYILPYYREGLDAVLVQDLGVMRFLKRNFPDLPLHASTQMTVTGPEGMKFLEKEGLTRVVGARELSLRELRAMHESSPLEIEAFIHGALCYSYSGQCLMSSIFGGRSGNRGRCAQPCRLSYQTAREDQKFKGKSDLCPLSLKDMCTIDYLPELLDAGVMSLKIEGRMKQPQYAAGVTGMYRKYLDLLFEKGPENYRVEEKDRRTLIDLFNRGGSCDGYLKQHNGPSMMAFSNEKKTGDIDVTLLKCRKNIRGKLMLYPGSPAYLTVYDDQHSATVSGAEVQTATGKPMEESRIR